MSNFNNSVKNLVRESKIMLSTVERITQVPTYNYKSTLVVIDSGVQDYQLLVTGIEPTAQVIVLDKQQNGITQITATLRQKSITSLQLIAHGSPGNLQLGSIALNLNSLYTYQQQLQNWQIEEILIYACEAATGEIGKTFLNQLHQLTGANIAASTEKVGNSQLGGSWELGVKIGQILSRLAIQPEIQENYPHLLADVSLAWATNFGDRNFARGNSIAVDSSGSVYTTGSFEGTADFDPGSGTFNLSTTGATDIFISKLNSNGSFAWAKSFTGGVNYDEGKSIVVDGQGNIYTTGIFTDTVDFDPGSGTFNLTSAGINDIFISKLNSDGSFAWAKQLGGTSDEQSYSITVDSAGNIYTTGFFQGIVDFDPDGGSFNLSSNGGGDIFVSKLNSDGSFAWAQKLGGANFDQGSSIAVDSTGNVYTTGYFSGIVDFDPSDGTFNLSSTSAGSDDIFISKLNSDGSFAWAKQLGGANFDQGRSIAVDSTGNIYTTGYFSGTADFDPSDGTFNLTSAGSNDIFISKLNSDGSFAWAKQLGSTGDDAGSSIAVDGDRNVYTTGSFSSTADFDPGDGTFNLTSTGSNDIFISKLNSDGSFAWAKKLGGTGGETGLSIAVDGDRNRPVRNIN
jgi:hypothetical protein